MEKSTKELKQILMEELDLYLSLLEHSKNKRKVLVEKTATELQEIVRQEEEIVQQLSDLDTKLNNCVIAITGSSESKLEDVLKFVSETAQAKEISEIASKLREVIKEIQAINLGNQKLVEQALEINQYSVKLMTNTSKSVTYGPEGTFADKTHQARSLLNLKA